MAPLWTALRARQLGEATERGGACETRAVRRCCGGVCVAVACCERACGVGSHAAGCGTRRVTLPVNEGRAVLLPERCLEGCQHGSSPGFARSRRRMLF